MASFYGFISIRLRTQPDTDSSNHVQDDLLLHKGKIVVPFEPFILTIL